MQKIFTNKTLISVAAYLTICILYFLLYDTVYYWLFGPIELNSIYLTIKTIIFLTITGHFIYIIIKYFLKVISDKEQITTVLQNYQNMYNSAPSMIFTTNKNNIITFVTDYCLTKTGYNREQVLGKNATFFLTQNSLLYYNQNILSKFIKSGSIKNCPLQVVKADGSVFDIYLSAETQRDKNGMFIQNVCVTTDITILKNIENELNQSRELYKKTIFAIPDIFIETDLNGNIIFVNNIGSKKLNNAVNQTIIGNNIKNFIAPEHKTKAEEKIKLMFTASAGVNEYNILLNNNRKITCEINGEILRHNNNEPYGMIFIIRDITQRKKIEEKLEINENRYRSLVETTNNIIFEIDLNASFIYLNPISQKILGYNLDTLYKMKITDICTPLSAKAFNIEFNKWKTGNTKPNPIEINIINGNTKQDIILELVTTANTNADNKIISFRGIARDITINKLHEQKIIDDKEQLEMVLKAGKMGVWHMDIENDIIRLDNMYQKILGYNNNELETINYSTFFELLLPNEISEIKNYYTDIYLGKSQGSSIEHNLKTKNGTFIWVLSIAKVVKTDSNNKPVEIMGIVKDITERKNADIEIRNLNSTKDKLFSIIAHDLKNPFNTILGFAELLKDNAVKYQPQKTENIANYIYESTKNIYTLLENLLEWAKSQRGTTKFNPTLFTINNLITDEIETLKYFASKKQITIYTANTNINVFADYNLVKIIVRNIVTNAIKFCNTNGQINIYCKQINNFIETHIVDNGVGMDNKTLANLFSLNKLDSKPGTAMETGTGLGLILCKEFIDKHDCQIWAFSEPGKGSEFVFTLPVKPLKTAITG